MQPDEQKRKAADNLGRLMPLKEFVQLAQDTAPSDPDPPYLFQACHTAVVLPFDGSVAKIVFGTIRGD